MEGEVTNEKTGDNVRAVDRELEILMAFSVGDAEQTAAECSSGST